MIFGDINLWTWLLLFVVYFIYDIIYTKYIIYVSKLNAFSAANSGVLLYLLTAYGTIQYVMNIWNVIPIALASWIGTYLTLKYENKKKANLYKNKRKKEA